MKDEVQDNRRKLKECTGHDFNPVNNMFVCANCGGVVDSVYYAIYCKGLEGGGSNEKS